MIIDINNFHNIVPDIRYIVHRKCLPSWSFEDIFPRNNFIFIYEGKGHFECNNEIYEAEKGDFIYYKKGDYRKAYTYENNLMKCFSVDFIFSCPMFNNMQWEYSEYELPFSFHQSIKDKYLFSRILEACQNLNNNWLTDRCMKQYYLRSSFLDLMSSLIMWKFNNNINFGKTQKVEYIINYLSENYDKHIEINQISKELNISQSYLCRIFKEITNKTPMQYLSNIRINKAKQLLEDGFKVKECSELVGFNDEFHFSKVFKKNIGQSPKIYKININR